MGTTIKDIAKEVGVTSPTVSKALNDRPGIKDELRTIIKQTAERLGYAPYLTARSTGMYDKSIKTIATIYPRLGVHLVEPLQLATDNVFTLHDYYELRYTIDIANYRMNQERENELLIKRLLSDQKISGIMFVFLNISDTILARFHKNGIPTILLNNYTDYGKCVTINNYQAMYDAVEKLIKLGHQKIGLIMPDENSEKVWMDRFNAYKKCLKDHGIQYDPNIFVHEWTFKLEDAGFATKKNAPEQPRYHSHRLRK